MKAAKKASNKKLSEVVMASKAPLPSGSGAGSGSKKTSGNAPSGATSRGPKKARLDIDAEPGKEDGGIQVHKPYIGKRRMAKSPIPAQTSKNLALALAKLDSPVPSAKPKGRVRSKEPTPIAPGRADEPSGTSFSIYLHRTFIITSQLPPLRYSMLVTHPLLTSQIRLLSVPPQP